MNEKFMEAVSYAIESANFELFDLLSKDFDRLEEGEKNTILERTVITCPNVDFIRHIFDCGFDINYQNENKNTLLHYAAVSRYPETVKFFIKAGLDLEAKNEWNATPLLAAAKECENPEVLRLLVESGADIHVKNYGGISVLITAAAFNPNPDVLRYLLTLGFDIEESDEDGLTPLLACAIWNSSPAVVEALMENGANIREKTKRGETLLHQVAFNRNPEMARYILPAFSTSEVDNSGESALEKVLCYGHSADVLELFLRKMKEEHIFYACRNENPEILETLFKFGYDSNSADSDGMTVMMLVAKINKNPAVIRMLRFYRVIWDSRDNEGRNVLHYAASNSDPTIYNWMLEDDDFKKFAGEKDNNGRTPGYYRENPDDF